MPDIQFYALAKSVCDKFNLPPIPFPVLLGREKEIFHPRGVALDLLLDELEHYLITHPEERVFFKEAGARGSSGDSIPNSFNLRLEGLDQVNDLLTCK